MATTKKVESRCVFTEIRADESKFELIGAVNRFNKLSKDLGGFREQCAPSAFDASLRSGTDVKCLLNHDPNFCLGSSRAGTLTLEKRADGLYMRCQLDRSSPQHQSVMASVRRQDISEMSFAFIPDDDVWEDNIPDPEDRSKRFTRRTLRSVQLLDVSPVVYAAYGNGATSVSARAERRAAAYVITPPSAVVPPTTAELNAQIDKYHLKRALELGAEIREAELRSAHDFSVDDTVMKGCERGIITQVNGNLLTVETGRGTDIWHAADCSSIRDASDFEEYGEDEIDGEKE